MFLRKIIILSIPLFIFRFSCRSQNDRQHLLLDSINKSREKDRGAFNLYIKKTKFEVIGGGFRNRSTPTQGFEPINFTYHIYLPFQFDLNYINVPAEDKILKINLPLIIHHSKYGNYAIGLGSRFSFLVYKRLYLSYQAGVVWCEVVKRNTNDGFYNMGFCLHHEFNLCYGITKKIEISANLIHLSNGGVFPGVKNNQDVIGLGLAYQL